MLMLRKKKQRQNKILLLIALFFPSLCDTFLLHQQTTPCLSPPTPTISPVHVRTSSVSLFLPHHDSAQFLFHSLSGFFLHLWHSPLIYLPLSLLYGYLNPHKFHSWPTPQIIKYPFAPRANDIIKLTHYVMLFLFNKMNIFLSIFHFFDFDRECDGTCNLCWSRVCE